MSEEINEMMERGLWHHQGGRLDEAEPLYRQVLERVPNHVDAMHLLGVIAHQTKRYDVAVQLITRAIELQPGAMAFYINLGNAYREWGNGRRALACYRQAADMMPGNAELRNNFGVMLMEYGELEEAISSFEKAVAVNPEYAEAWSNLAGTLRDAGRVEEGMKCCERAVALSPASEGIQGVMLFTMLFHPGFDAGAIARAHEEWNARFAEPLRKLIQPHGRMPGAADRRLRIGYVSGDFRDHVVARNILPLFRNRDRERFEVFCYYNSGLNDEVTAEFRSLVDGWRDIQALNDDQVAEQVRKDGIDILVDLSLHSSGNRLMVFARKPAPVQVTFAGYPGSTGLETMDYRLTDRWLDAVGEGDENYSEKSIRLESFWCYDARGDEPELNELPAANGEGFTFGCLNHFSKVNESSVRLWGRVLARVEKSRLLMLAPQGRHRERMVGILKECGVDRERVTFEGRRSRVEYLKLFHQIDLGLDTLPYNGHTTSLYSYWMGVPVVTLAGKTVVGRAGLSQLMNLGLGEFVARSEEEFVETAVRMAGDVPGLAALRGTLRERMRSSVLMDGRGFAKKIEAAYLEMWKTP